MNKSDTVFVSEDTKLGKDVKFFGFNNVYGCHIDDNSRIGTFVEIQKNAYIGKLCKIQSHTFICEGVHICDEVFIGHGVMFINDRFPKSTDEHGEFLQDGQWKLEKTYIGKKTSIGSGAIILSGIRIGENCLIGAGAVVTKNVEDNQTVLGIPARARM